MAQILGPIDIPSTSPVLRYSIYREEHAFNYDHTVFQGDETAIGPTDIFCYKIHVMNLTPNILTDVFARVRVRVVTHPPGGLGIPFAYTDAQNLNFIEPWPGSAQVGPIPADPGTMNCNVIRFRNLEPHLETTQPGHDQAVSALAFKTQSMHEGSRFMIELVFGWTPVIQQTCLIVQGAVEAPPQEFLEATLAD